MRSSPFAEGLQLICGHGVHNRQDGSFEQRLGVYRSDPGQSKAFIPEAELVVGLRYNYIHAMNVVPKAAWGRDDILAGLTGSNSHLCTEVVLFRLQDCTELPQNGAPFRRYQAAYRVVDIGSVCLSVVFTASRTHFLVNTRPFVEDDRYAAWIKAIAEQNRTGRRQGDLVVPDIQTAVELQIWRVTDFAQDVPAERVGSLRGPHAFTTKDSPFLLWSDYESRSDPPDYVASGGEDGHIYVWHVDHERLIRALPGHSEAVNCVSWNPTKPLVAACSDDHTATVWTVPALERLGRGNQQ
jgi:hypothetical protein